jgi:hypothetical protein
MSKNKKKIDKFTITTGEKISLLVHNTTNKNSIKKE